MQVKKRVSKHKPLSREDARSAVRAVRKAAGGRRAPRSKTWKKGGVMYNRFLGHFGPPSRPTK